MEEFTAYIRDLYEKRLGPRPFCSGYNIPLISNPSEEIVDKFIQQIINPYSNTLKASFTDNDLVCVILDRKPVAMIDNDYLPEENDENLDAYLRYVSVHAGVHLLITYRTEDPTRIYYKEEHWKDACILYLYHEQLLGHSLVERIAEVFNYFQGILLGYDLHSILLYSIGTRDLTPLIRQSLPELITTATDDEYGSYEYFSSYNLKYESLSREQKDRLYHLYYSLYVAEMPKARKMYKEATSIISYIKSRLTKEHEAMCIGTRKMIE